MNIDRRRFLASAIAVPSICRYRQLIRRADLGDIVFCRISDIRLLDIMQAALDVAAPISVTAQPGQTTYRYPAFIASYEPRSESYGITLCGTKATLTIAAHRLS